MKMPFSSLADTRNRERGAVAMLVAAMWTALFGMAVMAIDFGYLYTKRRGVQAAADAAVRSAMGSYSPGQTSTATDRAQRVAYANGYPSGSVTTSEPGANQFRVRITTSYPTFFGSLFGLGSKSVSGQATGLQTGGSSGNIAIHARATNACPAGFSWGLGFVANGNAILNVTGTIESNTQVYLGSSAGGSIIGTVKTPCGPLAAGDTWNQYSLPITTQVNTGAPYVDPLASNTFAWLNTPGNACPVGTNLLTTAGGTVTWTNTGGPTGCDTPTNRVYCSSGVINVNPVTSTSICPGSQATFISAQRVIIGANGEINLQPAAGAPNNLIAVAFGATMWSGVQCLGGDIDMGSASRYTLQGNIYAPNGCIWTAGAGTNGFTMSGGMVAQGIGLGMAAGSTWNFTGTLSSGGGGGGAWVMLD